MEEYKKPDDKADLVMAFKVFDSDNKGFIETKELKKAFMRLKGVTKEEIDELLEAANLEEDRRIYFEGTICELRCKTIEKEVKQMILPYKTCQLSRLLIKYIDLTHTGQTQNSRLLIHITCSSAH